MWVTAALTCSVVFASCGGGGASASIIFGSELVRRSQECVLSDGRQGRCMYPSSCAALEGPDLPDCVKPCDMVHHELRICCPKETTAPATAAPTSAPQRSCGRVGARGSLARNIAFGRASMQGHWPWMTLFGWKDSSGRLRWQCGGALISSRHVLTAAHCVERIGAPMVVRVGEHDLTTETEAAHQDVLVARAATPPNRRGHHDDIAVLTLAEPVRFADHVRPVCLPTSAAGDPAVGDDVVVAGWGRVQFAEPASDFLREAVQQVQATDTCERSYSQIPSFDSDFPGGFGTSKICALDTTGGFQDSCRGDSGGPLVARAADGTYTVVGVVSTGLGCGDPEFASIYTRVSSYLEWIQKQIA